MWRGLALSKRRCAILFDQDALAHDQPAMPTGCSRWTSPPPQVYTTTDLADACSSVSPRSTRQRFMVNAKYRCSSGTCSHVTCDDGGSWLGGVDYNWSVASGPASCAGEGICMWGR